MSANDRAACRNCALWEPTGYGYGICGASSLAVLETPSAASCTKWKEAEAGGEEEGREGR